MASLKTHELCRIAPSSANESSDLPLTFFDLFWFKFHPVERIFFYSLPQSDSSFFFDSVIPKLKNSLSLTLQHFLPLAGNIIWPSDCPKPFVRYSPGDGVSLIISESDADFDVFKFNTPTKATEHRSLVPQLDSSDSISSVLSLQITWFPNSGFCIGVATDHCVVDGKSSTMFMKAWAYVCRNAEESSSDLLPDFKPILDKNIIEDSKGLDILYLNEAISRFGSDQRSVKIWSDMPLENLNHSIRATYLLNNADLEKINRRILSIWDKVDEEEHFMPSVPTKLSTFVLTSAYVLVCVAKAIKKAENESQDKKVFYGFMVDCRARLKPPVHVNYFGNCVFPQLLEAQPGVFTRKYSEAIVAKRIYSIIKMLEKEKGVLEEADTLPFKWKYLLSGPSLPIGTAGSTRFGVYSTDFGWGRPVKVEIASVDRTTTIGLTERKDGNGVEVGLVLKKQAMDHFASIFSEELESF